MDSILGSSAVWTRHAPRKYDMPRSGISWHKPYLVKLDQNGLRYFVELFGSWGFKFPTPQWRILVISVISLEYLLEYLWYQLIDIYIYISIDITWSIEKLKHFDTQLVSGSDQIIRSVSHVGLDVGGPAKCWPCKKVRHGATVMPLGPTGWRESQGVELW